MYIFVYTYKLSLIIDLKGTIHAEYVMSMYSNWVLNVWLFIYEYIKKTHIQSNYMINIK